MSVAQTKSERRKNQGQQKDIEVGSVVQLRGDAYTGDGPHMTVEYIHAATDSTKVGPGPVKCVWFASDDTLHRGDFSTEVLSLVED